MCEVLDKGVCRLENSSGKVLKTTVNLSHLKTFTLNPMNTNRYTHVYINRTKSALFIKGNEENCKQNKQER